MTLRVAVDFGTSSTCAVISLHGRQPQVVMLDGQQLMSSAVYAVADGTLFVGQEAERQAAVDPSRYEPHPKQRIDEGQLLLGETVLQVVDAVHAVLRRVVSEARRLADGIAVDVLVLTHPADWGVVKTRLLRQSAGQLAREVALVPEPVAAAVFHAATFTPTDVNQERTVELSGTPGDSLAVLDLGGGTVDVSVVRRSQGAAEGFEVLATRGDASFGGADIDQDLLEHTGSLVSDADPDEWERLVHGRELADRRRRRVLRQDVRGAKETLSRHSYTDVPMPPPFADAHVTRQGLEQLVGNRLVGIVELANATIEAAGLRPRQLTAIFLVGGSSRIPMVSRLVHERTGVVPTTLDQPETVVARGALRAVQAIPDRTGALAGAPSRKGHGRAPVADHRTEVVTSNDRPRRPHPVVAGGAAPPRSVPAGPAPVRHHAVGHNAADPPPADQPLAPPPAPLAGGPADRPRRRGITVTVISVVVLIVATAVTMFVFMSNDDAEGRTFAQYSYRFSVPQGWAQTGDNVADRQVVVKPEGAQGEEDDDLVVVEEFVLSYDGDAEQERLTRELRTQVDAQSDRYSGFRDGHEFGGRDVIHYRESKSEASIDWYVVAHDTAQVSVGCQEAELTEQVRTACEQVVRTLEFTN